MNNKKELTADQKRVLDNLADRLRVLCDFNTNSAVDSYLLAQKLGYTVFKNTDGKRIVVSLIEPDAKNQYNPIHIDPNDNPNDVRTSIANRVAHYLVYQSENSNKRSALFDEYSAYLASSILMPKKEVEEMYNNLTEQFGSQKAIDVLSDKYGVNRKTAEYRVHNLGVL